MPDDLARATVRIDPDLSFFKDSLREKLATETADVHADVAIKPKLDSAGLTEEFAKTDAEMQAMGKEVTYKIKPEVDLAAVAEVKAEEEGLSHELEHTNEAVKRGGEAMHTAADEARALGGTIGGNLTPALKGAGEAAGGAGQGMGLLMTAALTLGPALIPVAAGAAAAIGALIPVTIAAGAGIAAFALAAANQLGPVTSEFKDLLATFQRMAAPDVIPVIHSAVSLLPELFSNMLPVVHSVSGEMEHLMTTAHDALEAPFWRNFVTLIQSQAGPALGGFMTLIGGVVKGLAGVAEAFAPFVGVVEGALSRMGNAIASWGQNLGASSGFQTFINYVRTEGPQVLAILDNLWHILMHVVEGFAPIGAGIIAVLGPLTSFLNLVLSINPILTTLLAGLTVAAAAFVALHEPVGKAAKGLKDFFEILGSIPGKIGNIPTVLGGIVGKIGDLRAAFQLGGEATTFSEALTAGGTGAETAAAGIGSLVAGMGGLAAVLPEVALGAAAVGGFFYVIAHGAYGASDAVKSMLAPLESMPTQTLPQMERALDAATAAQRRWNKEATNYSDSQEAVNASAQGTVDTLTKASEAANNAAVASHQLDSFIKPLAISVKNEKDNFSLLHREFGLSQGSAQDLANTLGIHLNKALNPTQVAQFAAALQTQALQAGSTASAIQHLADISGHTTTAITADIQKAVKTTETSWKSYGDAITAFSGQTNVSADKINEFYTLQTLAAQKFVSNIQKLSAEGFDPRFISQAIQAGPGQAGNLVNDIANQSADGIKKVMGNALTIMNQLQGQAVEQARLTQEAVQAPTSTFAAALPRALSISQALMAQNSRQAIATLASTFQGGLPAFAKVANEYGIQLPTSLAESIGLTVTKSGQLVAAATGPLNTGVPKAADAGTKTASAYTGAVGGAAATGGAHIAGTRVGEAFGGSVRATEDHAKVAGGKLGSGAAEGAGRHTTDTAKSGGAHSKAFTDAVSKGDVTKAANILVTAFATALGKDTKPVQTAGDDLGKALAKGIESFKDDMGKSGDSLGKALTTSIASYDDDMLRAGVALARALATGMTSQTGAANAARNMATQIITTIEQVIRGGVPVVQSDANRIGQAIAQAITNHTPDTHAAVSHMTQDFLQVLDSAVPKAQSEGTKNARAVETGIKSVDLSGAGRTLVGQFVSGLSNTSGAYNAGRGLAYAAAQGAASVGTGTFQAIGMSFTQGITAGINNSAAQAQLAQAAANTAHAAVNAAGGPQGLKHNSPSQLTHDELGIPFVQGFERGINASLVSLMTTSAGAATTAVKSAKSALTTSALTARVATGVATAPGAAGTTLTYMPTYHIQGGADPETVRKFQTMLDDHDRQLVHTIQSLT